MLGLMKEIWNILTRIHLHNYTKVLSGPIYNHHHHYIGIYEVDRNVTNEAVTNHQRAVRSTCMEWPKGVCRPN